MLETAPWVVVCSSISISRCAAFKFRALREHLVAHQRSPHSRSRSRSCLLSLAGFTIARSIAEPARSGDTRLPRATRVDKACSGFIHVTAREIAQPALRRPLSRGSNPAGYPTKLLASYPTNRQLFRVEPSSTDYSRLRGARPTVRAAIEVANHLLFVSVCEQNDVGHVLVVAERAWHKCLAAIGWQGHDGSVRASIASL